MKGGTDLSLREAHLKGRVVLESAEVGNIHIEGSMIATSGPLAVHLSGVRAKGLSVEEALFRWIAGGSKAESSALSDGDSLILVSIEKSRIVEGNIRVKNIQRAPVEVVLGEGATEGSGDGGGAEKRAVRATFQVEGTKLRPQSTVNRLIVAVEGTWDVEMKYIQVLGDLQIAVRSAESVIMMREVWVQRNMLLNKERFEDASAGWMVRELRSFMRSLLREAGEEVPSVGRVELEDVKVGGRLRMQGLRVEKELSLRDSWVGGGVYLEKVEVGRVEVPGRLHLEELRTVELDLSGAEVQGALSLQGVRVHTYSDRRWSGLTAMKVKDFEWMVMPLEREVGSLRWRLRWLLNVPPKEFYLFLLRLYQSYRLRYYQPPLRLNSNKSYFFLQRMYRGYLLRRYYLSPLSSYFVGYTAAERRRLRWRMRLLLVRFAIVWAGLILGVILGVILGLLFIPLYLIYKLLLLGTKAIRRLFRLFRKGS